MYKQNGLRKILRYYDYKLIFFLTALIVLGVYAIGSAKPSLQSRQIAGALAGAFFGDAAGNAADGVR